VRSLSLELIGGFQLSHERSLLNSELTPRAVQEEVDMPNTTLTAIVRGEVDVPTTTLTSMRVSACDCFLNLLANRSWQNNSH
jgi:hypothetical protein